MRCSASVSQVFTERLQRVSPAYGLPPVKKTGGRPYAGDSSFRPGRSRCRFRGRAPIFPCGGSTSATGQEWEDEVETRESLRLLSLKKHSFVVGQQMDEGPPCSQDKFFCGGVDLRGARNA